MDALMWGESGGAWFDFVLATGQLSNSVSGVHSCVRDLASVRWCAGECGELRAAVGARIRRRERDTAVARPVVAECLWCVYARGEA